MALSIEEKKELLYDSYAKSLDLDLAFEKLMLSVDEVEAIRADVNFMYRLKMVDIELQEDVIGTLRELKESENESVSLRATLELGKIFYSKKFNDKFIKLPLDNDKKNPVKIILCAGEHEDA